MTPRIFLISLTLLALAGCDQISQQLGLEDPARKEAAQQAEGKAVGGACRQSGRAIEDCYSIYSWLPKASIFDGWKEMDGYMRDNQMETIAPQLPPPESPAAAKKRRKAQAEAAAEAGTEQDKGESGDAPTEKDKSDDKSVAPEEKSSAKH